MAIGCALRKNFAASFSGIETVFAFEEGFPFVEVVFMRSFVGILMFVPQYSQAMKIFPATGEFGAPQAGH